MATHRPQGGGYALHYICGDAAIRGVVPIVAGMRSDRRRRDAHSRCDHYRAIGNRDLHSNHNAAPAANPNADANARAGGDRSLTHSRAARNLRRNERLP